MTSTRQKRIREDIGQITIEFGRSLPCEHAKGYSSWVENWLFPKIVTEKPDIVSINQAKIFLTGHYRVLRLKASKRCRNYCSDRGHVCIFHIWDQTYERLEALESTVEKPKLIKENSPPPKENIVYLDRLYGLEVK